MDNLVKNPKCSCCKIYWKPDETDILTSGLVAKTCKKCRAHQKELRENRDYSKGKIYVVKSLTSPDVYVGSTLQTLRDRMSLHRSNWKLGLILGKRKDIVKDITEWYIELYELFPCITKKELTTREGDIIKEIGTLNKNIAGRTKQQYKTDHLEETKQYNKQYYADHIEKSKQYYIEHKEKAKQYNTDRKDKIKQYKKQYNKDYNNKKKLLKSLINK